MQDLSDVECCWLLIRCYCCVSEVFCMKFQIIWHFKKISYVYNVNIVYLYRFKDVHETVIFPSCRFIPNNPYNIFSKNTTTIQSMSMVVTSPGYLQIENKIDGAIPFPCCVYLPYASCKRWTSAPRIDSFRNNWQREIIHQNHLC